MAGGTGGRKICETMSEEDLPASFKLHLIFIKMRNIPPPPRPQFLIFIKIKCNLKEAGRSSSDIVSQIFLPPVPPAITPVLTPSLGGFLTPLSASVMPVTSASVQVCNVVVGNTSCSTVSSLSKGQMMSLAFKTSPLPLW
jgi:hypothetical protein